MISISKPMCIFGITCMLVFSQESGSLEKGFTPSTIQSAEDLLLEQLPQTVRSKNIDGFKQLLDADFRYIDKNEEGHPFVAANYEQEVSFMSGIFLFPNVEWTLQITGQNDQFSIEDVLADSEIDSSKKIETWRVYRTNTTLKYIRADGEVFEQSVIMAYKLRPTENGEWKIVRMQVIQAL